jgi:hypothetical protein
MRQRKARARQKKWVGVTKEKKRKWRRKRKKKVATKNRKWRQKNEGGSARFGEGNGAVFGVKGGLHVKGSVEGLGFKALHLGEKCHDA